MKSNGQKGTFLKVPQVPGRMRAAAHPGLILFKGKWECLRKIKEENYFLIYTRRGQKLNILMFRCRHLDAPLLFQAVNFLTGRYVCGLFSANISYTSQIWLLISWIARTESLGPIIHSIAGRLVISSFGLDINFMRQNAWRARFARLFLGLKHGRVSLASAINYNWAHQSGPTKSPTSLWTFV